MTKSKLKLRKKRNPDRSRPTASISIAWDLYDRLDALAEQEHAPIAHVIEALVDDHEKGDGDG